MLKVIEGFWQVYNDSMGKADPRVLGLPLAQSPGPFLSILLLYLLAVLYGPKMIEQQKPLKLKWILVVYNFLMIAFNFWIFTGLFTTILREPFSFTCHLVDYSDNHDAVSVMFIGYLFFVSKILELLDTAFFILRRKYSQITFLHVYHHTTIAIVAWCGMKWVSGGQSMMYPLINSFVHMVMYTYYGMAAIGPHMQKYLWWKRYLTIIQLGQFVFMMTHSLVNHFTDCEFPKLFNRILVSYLLSILILFINFYIRAYSRRPAPSLVKHPKTE